VSYGINKNAVGEICKEAPFISSGVGTAHAHTDDSLARFIFHLERVKGFTMAGDRNSGRFKCQISDQVGDDGEMHSYWVCDNGDRFDKWTATLVNDPVPVPAGGSLGLFISLMILTTFGARRTEG
jgi:hypothetical protein